MGIIYAIKLARQNCGQGIIFWKEYAITPKDIIDVIIVSDGCSKQNKK